MKNIDNFNEVDFAEWFKNNRYMQSCYHNATFQEMVDKANSNIGKSNLKQILNYYMRKETSSQYSGTGYHLHVSTIDTRKEFIRFLYSDQVGDYLANQYRHKIYTQISMQKHPTIRPTETEKRQSALDICDIYRQESVGRYMAKGYHPNSSIAIKKYYNYADYIFEYIAQSILSDSVYKLLEDDNCLQAYDSDSFEMAFSILRRAIENSTKKSRDIETYYRIEEDSIYKYYVWSFKDKPNYSVRSFLLNKQNFPLNVVPSRSDITINCMCLEPSPKSVDHAELMSLGELEDITHINSNDNFFSRLIKHLTSIKKSHRMSLDQDRYEEMEHKCFILLGQNEKSLYKSLIKGDNYKALDQESGDYLDIFYSDSADVSEAVNVILKHKKDKDNEFAVDEIPCVYFWKDRLSDGKAISIKGLDSKRIIDVVRSIVGGIQKKLDFDQIVEKAKECSKGGKKDMKDEKGTIINNGVMVGDIKAKGSVTFTGNTVNHVAQTVAQETEWDKQLDAFIKALDAVNEMNDAQKEGLKKNLQNYKEAEDKKDEGKLASAKDALKTAFTFMAEPAAKALLDIAKEKAALIYEVIKGFIAK